tara:strand:+ start:163622 stop:164851 length:1230 start_codon:yes stop_codon:yes gene_type:complete
VIASGFKRQQFEIFRSIFRDGATVTGDEFLRVMVRGLGNLLDAETTFVARAIDAPATAVRVLAAWKDGAEKKTWDYELTGNPCQLIYNGEPTLIPCDIGAQFPKKGESGYESFIGIPLRNLDGKIIGHIAIFSSKARHEDDFALEVAQLWGLRAETEVRRMIEREGRETEIRRLRETKKESDDMLAIASHDLRAPLSSVISTLAALQTGVFGEIPTSAGDYISKVQEVSESLLKMTNDILDQERLSSGHGNIARERILLVELIDAAMAPLQIYAKASHIEMRVGVDKTGIFVNGDRVLLERLLNNLLSNAIKFSPRNDFISITAEALADSIRVLVADHGPGVPQSYWNRIFERFSQVPTDKPGRNLDSGIGLSIAKSIAQAHGGDLTYEPNPGGGSQFVVDLPMSAKDI